MSGIEQNILISFMLVTRKRVDSLKGSISRIYDLAKYPDKIELFIGFDDDDLETLDFVKTDEIFQKYKNIRCFSGPRVGLSNNELFFRELYSMTSGDIIIPWADDSFVTLQDWDAIFLFHKDEAVMIGWGPHWVITRKAISKYEWMASFIQKTELLPRPNRFDVDIPARAHKEGLFIDTKNWWKTIQPYDQTRNEGRCRGWILKDTSVSDNFKLTPNVLALTMRQY